MDITVAMTTVGILMAGTAKTTALGMETTGIMARTATTGTTRIMGTGDTTTTKTMGGTTGTSTEIIMVSQTIGIFTRDGLVIRK